jgi:hypothetical protein
MFYETWGALLERADDVLRHEVRGHVSDPMARDRLDAVATLLGDLAAMWPQLFAGLERETRIYEAALASGELQLHDDETEPLARYRAAVAALDTQVQQARELPEHARVPALHQIRTAIAAAAEVQGAVVRRAAERAAESTVRRI